MFVAFFVVFLAAALVTLTVCHAARTAFASLLAAPNLDSAASTVSAANPAKSMSLVILAPVTTSYQISPAPSQDGPPMLVAARWNARLGMPELV